jgi:hypothetical protein
MIEVRITAKHSNVCYIYEKLGEQAGFKAVEKATSYKNSYDMDLFKYDGIVYEGRSGARFISESELSNLDDKIKSGGGIEKLREIIEQQIAKTGESPRYTHPDERKQDLFPPRERDENIIFAKDVYGKKHYYFRFHNEDGVELFTLKKENSYFRTVFVQCEGYMIALDQHHRLDEIIKRVAGFENGVKGEIERIFNESMADPRQWADVGFANVLGRTEEAERHNAPIREFRAQKHQQWKAERKEKQLVAERAAKAEYEQAIKKAEAAILNHQAVHNTEIQGKSLIMQLFREHEINVPLKTRGWIIRSLDDVYYHEGDAQWSYHYIGRPSTVFEDYMARLASAIQTKQQYEEMTQNSGYGPPFDIYSETEEENEDDMEI